MLLKKWIKAEKYENSNRWLTANRLSKDFKMLADRSGFEFKYNARSLGMRLRNIQKELSQQGIKISSKLIDGIRHYQIQEQ